MKDINVNMRIPGLNLRPPIEGSVKLSDDMQQTLALLTGRSADKRELLRCSESGVLNICEPRVTDIVHYTGSGANDTQTGDDVSCSECMIMGHPDNAGLIWVRPNTTATVNNSWPLAAYDVLKMTLDNLSQLNMLIVADGEKVIVAYTR